VISDKDKQVYGPVKTFANRSWGASRTTRKKVLKRFTLRKAQTNGICKEALGTQHQHDSFFPDKEVFITGPFRLVTFHSLLVTAFY
jgi:hypothetical protein